jgi:RNA polymerase sigma-70 factor (ECF subfamily)
MTRQPPDEQFVQLLTSHQSRLAGFIFALVPSDESAQDILQETNLVLWRKAKDFTSGEPEEFWAWASQVARYQVMAHKRDVLRDRHVLSETLMERIANVAQRVSADSDGRTEMLRACIDKLPAEKKQLVTDRFIAAESVEQIAVKTGKSPSAISKLLFRVRRALVECVLRAMRKGLDT